MYFIMNRIFLPNPIERILTLTGMHEAIPTPWTIVMPVTWFLSANCFVLAFDGDSLSKRKHRKKKRKKRRLENADHDVSSNESNDVSISDGPSDSESEFTAGKSYEVKSTSEGENLRLKISLKRPVPTEANTSDNSTKDRKEKKHKKSKDREKKRHHSRDKGLSSTEGANRVEPIIPSANGIPMTAKPMLPAASPSRETFSRKAPLPMTHSSHPPLNQFGGFDPNAPFDLRGVFDHTKPDFSAFPVNFFEDLPPTVTAHSNAPIHHNHPINNAATSFAYNDFLSSDLLSSANIPPPPAHKPSPHVPDVSVYQGNFMVASHLDYPDNAQSTLQNATAHGGSDATYTQAAPMGLASYLNSTKPQSAAVSGTSPPPPLPSSSRPTSVKPAARRRPPVSKRTYFCFTEPLESALLTDSFLDVIGRRCNEVEGLRSWTVKYPGQKNPERNSDESSAWDAAVDRQAIYLRNKRRRMTRQPTALAADYVLESDKDYPKYVSHFNSPSFFYPAEGTSSVCLQTPPSAK